MAESLVWYASYGSNMDASRMMCYIRGGTPKGAFHKFKGCSNISDPIETRPISLDYTLYFAGQSKVRGGATAFIDYSMYNPASTYGRAYLITLSQFEEVSAQESSRPKVSIDLAALKQKGNIILGNGKYDNLLCVGVHNNILEVTCTSPFQVFDESYAPPLLPYAQTIANGLREAHGLNNLSVAKYLLACGGVSQAWTVDSLYKSFV